MHEFSIASSIVESVLDFVQARQVRKVMEVRLAVGELTCVEEEQLRFCYMSITRETPIEESALSIEEVPARVKCRSCGYVGGPKYWEDALYLTPVPTLQCPQCGKAVEAEQGNECAIKTIKYVA